MTSVTADFQETATALPDSGADTPNFEATPEVTREQPEIETLGTGEDEPASTPEAPRTDYTLDELNELYREAKLTDPTLVQKREELLQRDWQSKRDSQRRLAEMQAQDRAREEQALKADQALQAELAANRQREIDRASARGEMPDLELIEERNQASLANYKAKMSDIVLEPIKGGLRTALLSIYGDTPQNRQAVNARDVHELITDLYGAGYSVGRKAGPGDDHVVLSKKDYDKAISDAKREAADALKAANPSLKTADRNPERRGGGSDFAALEAKLAKTGDLTETEWNAYESGRHARGLR